MKGGERMRKVLLILSVLAVVALAVLNLFYDDRIPPDEVYTMANRNIEWTYPGK